MPSVFIADHHRRQRNLDYLILELIDAHKLFLLFDLLVVVDNVNRDLPASLLLLLTRLCNKSIYNLSFLD